MRYLITGCAGFIGSHLTERLLKEGHDCIGVDAFTDYYPRSIKDKNIAIAKNNPNFNFIEGNLLDLDLKSLICDVDVVFHQAAQAGVRASWGNEFHLYTDWNILATQKLLEACRAAKKLQMLVYASSSSVYGQTNIFPMREDHLPAPFSPYGVSKLAAEHLCKLYTKNFGTPTVSLRYFTVYGPRQRPDMAFHKFFKAAINNKTIEIYGDGRQTRDFTYIDDAVDANLLAAKKGGSGEVYNIGGGTQINLKEVIEIMSKITGKKIPVEFCPRADGDVEHTMADTQKARTALGYSPSRDLYFGLEQEWIWIREVAYEIIH